MRSAIFVWASLLLIGSLSISQGYPNEDSDEDQSNEFKARFESLTESSESSESKRGEWFNGGFMKRSSACTACNPACQSDELCLRSGVCVCPGGEGNSPCPTQHHHLCAPSHTAGVKPVLKVTFGDDGTDQFSKKKPHDLGFSTTYKQKTTGQTNDGDFSIQNKVPQDFGAWLGGGLSHGHHCKGDTKKGYMMIVNAQPTANLEFLSVKASKLCVGLVYQFTFYIANIVKKGSNIQLPKIKVQVKSKSGHLIASSSTGSVPEQDKLTWELHGLSFIATSDSVSVSLISVTPGGSGNDFAIDDIKLTSCAPKTNGIC